MRSIQCLCSMLLLSWGGIFSMLILTFHPALLSLIGYHSMSKMHPAFDVLFWEAFWIPDDEWNLHCFLYLLCFHKLPSFVFLEFPPGFLLFLPWLHTLPSQGPVCWPHWCLPMWLGWETSFMHVTFHKSSYIILWKNNPRVSQWLFSITIWHSLSLRFFHDYSNSSLLNVRAFLSRKQSYMLMGSKIVRLLPQIIPYSCIFSTHQAREYS